MDKLEFLNGRRNWCESTIESCENKLKFAKEELEAINELIAETKGRQSDDNAAR